MKVSIIGLLASAHIAAADDTPQRSDEPTADDVEKAPVPGQESGRLDRTSGDSTLRDIGQGALFVPKVAIEVAMAPVRAGVWAYDRYELPERWKRTFFDPTYTYGLYPSVVFDSSYGLTVGARFVHRNLFGEHEHLALRAGTGGEYRARALGAIRSGTRFGDRTQLQLGGEIERRPGDAFYGIGNSTSDTAAYHRQELLRSSAFLDVRAVSDLYVRTSGALTDLSFGGTGEMNSVDVHYDPMQLTGWTGVRNTYGEVELRWDSRRHVTILDDHAVSEDGTLLAVYGGRVHQLEAGDDYWRYGGDLQHFWRISAGPRMLATRLHAEAVTGSLSDVAFTQLPELGGKTWLRGYPRDRFRDRTALLGSLEYEWDVGRYLMASTFVDVGRVFPSWGEVDTSKVRAGYGVSLQLHESRHYVAGLQIASSVDGGVFVDLAFDPVFVVDRRTEKR